MSSSALLFVIVGKNEPLYEYNKVQAADSVTRQNYFVLHSALDLVEKAAWTTNNMYLKVVDNVRNQQESVVRRLLRIRTPQNIFPWRIIRKTCFHALFYSFNVLLYHAGESSANINIPDSGECQAYAPS